ncbi:hypothetical protein BDY21DRAFT_423800 [Lineolata rhizophorae]|uniref:RRM domain-containing protein n=1 Tax=Lineolata rhizophorae TaxID=578093 RepID=A0A6A6NR15_9PEZI|nr:hypothetical protein BDY21DRAFT_423800 [Lineolata rhizophorae]
MDRSLDEVISERQRANNRGSRDRRRENWPRDGVRKSSQRDDSRNLDRDWVHDRYDEDSDSRRPRGSRFPRVERYSPSPEPYVSPSFPLHTRLFSVVLSNRAERGARIRVDNLHYDLTEDDLRELFTRIGPITNLALLYDRQDRSRGIAYVTYPYLSDARLAIREFDGANAHGQPIRLSLVASAASGSGGGAGGAGGDLIGGSARARPRPGRSLFDRIESPVPPAAAAGESGGDGGRRRRHRRSMSPPAAGTRRSDVSKPPPEHIDRYVPGGASDHDFEYDDGAAGGVRRRSPLPRRRGPRGGDGGGRRPGERRERSRNEGGGGGRRGGGGAAGGGARDEGGRGMVQGRPRKTAEELDAEMEDYWGGGGGGGDSSRDAKGADAGVNGGAGFGAGAGAGQVRAGDGDVDMIE